MQRAEKGRNVGEDKNRSEEPIKTVETELMVRSPIKRALDARKHFDKVQQGKPIENLVPRLYLLNPKLSCHRMPSRIISV